MSVSYLGQLRYGGIHEFDNNDLYNGCYLPFAFNGGTISVAPTTDTSVDWGNVLRIAQPSAGALCYVKYSTFTTDHGESTSSASTYAKNHHIARFGIRLRIPTEAFGTSELLEFFSLNNTIIRVGMRMLSGQLIFSLRDGTNAITNGITSLTQGAWYDLDFYVNQYTGELGLYSSPAGADSWTQEVYLLDSTRTGSQQFNTFQIGCSAISNSGSPAAKTLEVHSLGWQFDHWRRAFYTTSAKTARLTVGDDTALRLDASHDTWWSTWVMVEDGTADRGILGKSDVTSAPEWDLYWSTATQSYVLSVTDTNGTTSTISPSSASVVSRWEHVFFWYDASTKELHIRRNNGAEGVVALSADPAALTNSLRMGSRWSGGAASTWHNGRIGSTGFGRLPSGSLAAGGLVDTIAETLYNNGVPKTTRELDSSFRTASGLSSYWDMDEGDRPTKFTDMVGNRDLTRTGTATLVESAIPIWYPNAETSRAPVEVFPASRIADVTDTEAAPILLIRQGEWRGVTHARVVYGLAPNLTDGVGTAWEDITGVDDTQASIHIFADRPTGLYANSTYYYRYELSRNGTDTAVQSSIRRFTTLPAVGSVDDIYQQTASCSGFNTQGLPAWDLVSPLHQLQSEGKPLHRIAHLGDLHYEWFDVISGDGCVTTTQRVRNFLTVMYDPPFVEATQAAAMIMMPSDHEVTNDADSRMRLDPVARAYTWDSTDAAAMFVHQANYPVDTTLGQIWDGAETAMLWWMFLPRLGSRPTTLQACASGTDWNSSSDRIRYGRVWELRLDTIHNARNHATGVSLGAELFSWIQGEIDAFASDPDADLLLILSESNPTRTYEKTNCWRAIAPAETAALFDYMNTALVGTGKGVVTMGGDNHAGAWLTRDFEGASGFLAAPWGQDNSASPLKLNIGASPLQSASNINGPTYLPSNALVAPYVGWYWDASRHYALDKGGQIKSSGVLTRLNQSAGTVSVDFWTDFGVRYQPTEVQNFSLMPPKEGADTPTEIVAVVAGAAGVLNPLTTSLWVGPVTVSVNTAPGSSTALSIAVMVGNTAPLTPTILSASVNAGVLTLTSSTYTDADSDGHLASQWQVQAAGGDWSAVLFDSGQDTSHLESIQIDVSGWAPGSYEARVRYLDDSVS